jgi:hypothetical protein
MEGKQKVALTFALYQDDALLRRETVTHDIVKVGRDPKSHLRVDDELASRMHAVIEIASPDQITIIDLGNGPGTLVNGARVNKHKLVPGDNIAIGRTRLVLEKAETVAVAAAAPRNPFLGSSAPLFGGGDPFAFNNPFAAAAPAAIDDVPEDAPEGSYTYTLVKAGPDLLPDECETSASSIEIMILWAETVLHVSHLTPPRSFYVGEEQGKHLGCDYFLPSEKLGATRAPVVLVDRAGSANLVLLPRATGTIELPGQPKMSVDAAIQGGFAQPCAELAGAHQIALVAGAKANVELGGLVFRVGAVNAGRTIAAASPLDTKSLPFHGVSMAAHLGLLAALAFTMPAMAYTDGQGASAEEIDGIKQYMIALGEREQEQKQTEQLADANADNSEGGTGTRSIGEEGKMGSETSKDTGKKYGVFGPKENQDPHIARAMALRDAADFGMIGLLNNGAGGDINAPTAPWGGADSLGNDPMSALGNMWGSEIGESGGTGGLGLTGIGEGGGGKGEGIGLGYIGTIGHGVCGAGGCGNGDGFGKGHGRLGQPHRTSAPRMTMGNTVVGGHLPPEVIQRIVRQNFGRFRLCYENGLRGNPNLQGRVGVRFIIGRDGAVSSVGNGGSDMPDNAVVSCVVRAFYGLSFPQPESGIVTVVYPIMFSPGAS